MHFLLLVLTAIVAWLSVSSSSSLASSSMTAFCNRLSNKQNYRTTTVLQAAWWPPLLFIRDDNTKTTSATTTTTTTTTKEVNAMYQVARTIDEHKHSQEISERTTIIMDELSSTLVIGRSKAGPKNSGILSSERKGGVKVTFNGQQRPISVEVDPRFLFSSSTSNSNNNNNGDRSDGGIVSIDELNDAIADAMCDGYERSGKVMDDKLRGLYEQLGLTKDPIAMPSFAQDEKNK